MSDLSTRNCSACEGGIDPLSTAQIENFLGQVHSRWSHYQKDGVDHIKAEFTFNNYYETTAFINGVVWMCHQQDHHPDIEFSYKTATIHYSTHAINGLSENDFICAAKIDALLG